jgi:S-adenosylmethionine:diacylglycerol 3-amino-3-carboxypropyl transferase
MRYLYDFGISQDDPNVEGCVLPLENSNLLCVASGGEVPLSLLANFDTRIKAVDISANQIRLCKLKQAASLNLEPWEAAVFLGFKKDVKKKWEKYYGKVIRTLTEEDVDFWNKYKFKILYGPIKYSRFERYLSFFCKIVTPMLGKKKLIQLFEMESIEAQKSFFDQYLDKKIIFWIFRIAFSPRIYKKRGLAQQALIHQKGNDMASRFYGRFRDFITATPVRSNFYLQFYFMGEVWFDEALPDYLKPVGVENLRERKNNLVLEVKSIQDEIIGSPQLHYCNYALSNISDWLSVEEMNDLLNNISTKSVAKSNILLRYIHKNPVNEKTLKMRFNFNSSIKENIRSVDRFPFYSVIKAQKV